VARVFKAGIRFLDAVNAMSKNCDKDDTDYDYYTDKVTSKTVLAIAV